MAELTKTLQVRIEPALNEQPAEAARALNTQPSKVVRAALALGMERLKTDLARPGADRQGGGQ